ncbi:MAG: hypothetical protein ACRDT4_00065 [Micromonosporaceae bacterium]
MNDEPQGQPSTATKDAAVITFWLVVAVAVLAGGLLYGFFGQ